MLEQLDNVINQVNGFLWSYVLIVLLIGIGLYFTVRTKFVQIIYIKEMFRVLTHGIKSNKKDGAQGISSFQAFCISTASRVGVGNIAGIAIAITLGGPGAIFWMWVIALVGAATGFVESTLAQIYKVPFRKGGYHGGPAYYIANVLKQPAVAALFAVLITVTFALSYNSVQSNTIASSLKDAYDFDPIITGLVLCILTSMVIFGGAHRIAKVTQFLVPFMAIAYFIVAFIILAKNITAFPAMLGSIFYQAFCPDAAIGGGFAAVIMTGIKRGLFSNEAGEGSVPNAAACAVTSHPVKQGLIQALGVFVDTLFICSASAVIVLLSGQYDLTNPDYTGIALVQGSLKSQLGDWVVYFMSFTITLFAFSSIIGNYYYGEININYLTSSPVVMTIFRIFVVFMVFFGSYASLSVVWDLADLFMALLALTNLYAIVRLGKYAFFALRNYYAQKNAGIMEPKFKASLMENQDGVYSWGNEEKWLKDHE